MYTLLLIDSDGTVSEVSNKSLAVLKDLASFNMSELDAQSYTIRDSKARLIMDNTGHDWDKEH